MLEALQQHFDVVTIIREPFPAWFMFARKVVRRLTGRAIDLYWISYFARLAPARALRELRRSHADFIVAVAITPLCAQLVDKAKTVFISDATQAAMMNYYPNHSSMTAWMKRSAARLETASIQGATVCTFPSNWAAQSAIANHGGDPDKVSVVHWGANLIAQSYVPPEERPTDVWRILFVGVDWKGKGGDIALEAIRQVRARGINAHLDIVGSAPSDPPPRIDGVTFHGFLNKNDPGDRARLEDLFRRAHISFLPTQFEALGIVFAEAASFAVPSVTYDTGGISGMVVHEQTGILLPEGAPAGDFAEALFALISDRQRYLSMANAALARSREVLNWNAWALRLKEILMKKSAAEGSSS